MSSEKPTSLDEIITLLKTSQLTPEESLSLINKFEEKIKADIDKLFSALAGAYIHEIQSKIGFAKGVISMVVESQGAFEYEPALNQAITVLKDILALYKKSGVSTQL